MAFRMPHRLTPSVQEKSDGGRSHMSPPANTPGVVAQHVGRAERLVRVLGQGVDVVEVGDVGDEAARAVEAVRPSRPAPWPSMSAATTRICSAAKRRTSARPMPLPAPVTTATLPWSCSIGASWQRIPAMSERIEKLVAELTLDEKAALAGGRRPLARPGCRPPRRPGR